ncbi:MAG: nucleotidyltransferase [Candidatus ainarchaeum sp.]|nr:nucleotidyltransferase [Candidatus ainarchaeum sp.]
MELEFKKNRIFLERELSNLDKLVVRFTKILHRLGIDYVIISGYIAILFGRSRHTEDVDLFIEEMPFEKFRQFWQELDKEGFECMNTSNVEEAYTDYLKEMLALRFSEKGMIQPNFELKFPKTDLNQYSLKNKIIVEIGKEKLNTSKIELQIAFKLYLGSDKDIEDAVHLWEMFKGSLNMELFNGFTKRLKVEGKIRLLK